MSYLLALPLRVLRVGLLAVHAPLLLLLTLKALRHHSPLDTPPGVPLRVSLAYLKDDLQFALKVVILAVKRAWSGKGY